MKLHECITRILFLFLSWDIEEFYLFQCFVISTWLIISERCNEFHREGEFSPSSLAQHFFPQLVHLSSSKVIYTTLYILCKWRWERERKNSVRKNLFRNLLLHTNMPQQTLRLIFGRPRCESTRLKQGSQLLSLVEQEGCRKKQSVSLFPGISEKHKKEVLSQRGEISCFAEL